MVLLDDDVYQETKDLVLGKRERSRLLVELSDWFRARYSVKVLNVQFDELKDSTGDRYRLRVIIADTRDYQKMYLDSHQPNDEYQKQISIEFRKLALKHRYADKSKLEDLFVTFVDFSDEAKVGANWRAEGEVRTQIKNQYPVVWDVVSMFSSSVVFYYSDTDIPANEKNGISKAIADTYYSILKKHDELGYLTRENINLKFDSKENLDRNYEGNLFYYTR